MLRKNNTAFLLIGGNMGDRASFLDRARQKIAAKCGAIIQQSSLYQTAAWGIEEQPAFLNQVVCIETKLPATVLLTTILDIEKSLGRKRDLKYGPRTIDIDILLFNNDVIREDALTVPHPQMQNRRFVLAPLCEIAPMVLHPVLKKPVAQLLEECPDTLHVQKIT